MKKKQNPREKLFTLYRDKLTGEIHPDDFGHDRFKQLSVMRQILGSLSAALDEALMSRVITSRIAEQVKKIMAEHGQKIVTAGPGDLQALKKGVIRS